VVARNGQLNNDSANRNIVTERRMNEKKEIHREIFPCNQGEYFIIACYYRVYYSTASL